ncbi:MAG: hypothetical protein J7L39_00055 [Candidatus Aenigmarchaeota archaeon]|nr:hypothetical protein [Candidatus Aenigmarchaeota archaeon]
MGIKHITKKIKLGRFLKIKRAPRWADIRKFGLKRARTRSIRIEKIKSWRRNKLKV